MAGKKSRDCKHDQLVRGQDNIQSQIDNNHEQTTRRLSNIESALERQAQMRSSREDQSVNTELSVPSRVNLPGTLEMSDINNKLSTESAEKETNTNTTQGRKSKLSKDDSLRSLWDFDLNFGDRLSEVLDVKYAHAKYWPHLAQEFGIKPITYEAFGVADISSPTERLLEHLSATQPNYKVKDFCKDCKTVDANEVCSIVERNIKAGILDDGDLLRKMCDKAPAVLDEVVLKLDRENRLWQNLARERKIPQEKYLAFQVDRTTNPAREFFDLLRTEGPEITIGNFKEKARKLKLELIPDILEEFGVSDDKMLLSDLSKKSPGAKREIESFLNKPETDHLWKLAQLYNESEGLMEDIVDLETVFRQQENTHSPTRQVMKYVLASLPQYTIEDLIIKLWNINRKDCFVILEPYLRGGKDDTDEITERLRKLKVAQGSEEAGKSLPSTGEDRATSGIPASDVSVNPFL